VNLATQTDENGMEKNNKKSIKLKGNAAEFRLPKSSYLTTAVWGALGCEKNGK
jgi:hypothetical protein